MNNPIAYKVTIESKDSITEEVKANDKQATSFMKDNNFLPSSTLTSALENALNRVHHKQQTTIICSHSGIASILQTSLITGSILTHSFPLSSFYNMLSLSSEDLYSKTESILAGIVLAVFKDKGLLRSVNPSAGMDNLTLSTAGKYVLVEAIKTLNFLVVNNVDIDTLPKLDISYETHSTGIKSFEQPLTNFITILREEALKSKELLEHRVQREYADRLELEARNKERRNAKEIKTVETAYETKRADAKKALREAALDLISLNYRKLTEVLTTATATKTGAELMSTELKSKAIFRLDEIITKYSVSVNNEALIKQCRLIKEFMVLANSARVEARKESALERVSDISKTNTVEDKKARLLAILGKGKA